MEENVKHLLPVVIIFAILLALFQYLPFFPLGSIDLRTTTVANTGTSELSKEIYRIWMTATILWTTTTMPTEGRTATVPIPYTAVYSDVMETYTSRATILWTSVNTIIYSTSTTKYETLAKTNPVSMLLLLLALATALVVIHLHRRGCLVRTIR